MSLSSRLSLAMDADTPPLVEWEECDCPLCGSSDWTPVIEAPDQRGSDGLRFLVVQCQRCELCFTNPRPSEHAISRFYPEDYGPHFHWGPLTPRAERAHGDLSIGPVINSRSELTTVGGPPAGKWWRRLLPFSRQSPRKFFPVHGTGRLLDFGCGGGSYLLRMRKQGWNVVGVDSSLRAVERLRSLDQGIEVHHGTLPHRQLPAGAFDAVTMWQSLEHVHRPLEVLQAAHQLLVRGGQIVVAVHNIQSLPFRWFGSAWFALDLPRHLTHFSPATLRHMLHRAGFKPGKVQMIRTSAWLRHSARLARQGGGSRWASFLGTRLGSNLGSWYCYLAKMSDCMMVMGVKE